MPETKRLVEGSGGGGLLASLVGGGVNGKEELKVENKPLSARGPAAVTAARIVIAVAMANSGF